MERLPTLIREAVFPTHCAACGSDGSWFCSSCQSSTEILSSFPCPRCLRLGKHDDESDDVIADAVMAVGFYHDPRLRSLVHGLKYEHATCLLPSLGELVRRYREEVREPWPWAGRSDLALQSLPGAPDRIQARGFDQADLIRDLVRSELVPWAHPVSLLERKGSMSAQADLEPGPLRSANVHGCYSLKQGEDIPEAVLIIDDVVTTGATMREAATILRRAGVKHVYGFAIAIGK